MDGVWIHINIVTRYFLNNLNAALEKEFPSITSLGEATVNTVAAGAYFCRNNLNVPWKSNLTGNTGFSGM